MTDEENETILLGGNIELSGFRDIDGGSMIVIKKIVGSYIRKFNDKIGNLQKFSLHLKKVHANEEHALFELYGNIIDNGKTHAAEVSERNLFIAVDTVMKKLENSIN